MKVHADAQEVPTLKNLEFLLKKADVSQLGIIDGTKTSALESAMLMCLKEGSSKESNVAIGASTFLKRTLIIANEFKNQLPDAYYNDILSFIYSNWDSSVDVIGYDCVDIFQLLMANHSGFCQKCSEGPSDLCPFISSVAKDMFSSPLQCKALYRCILILVESHNCSLFVDMDFIENLYSLLGNVSLSAVASRLIVQNLIHSEASDSNNLFHVSCFVKALTSDTSSIRSALKDKLIPVLFKSSFAGLKPFVNKIIGELDKNKQQLKEEAALEAILSLAQLLVNHESSDTVDYSTFISSALMSKALLYVSGNVRFAAYSLICTHPRKRREVKERDLLLVSAYFKTNFSEQSPSIRQKVLAALKKLLASIHIYAEHLLKRHGDYPAIYRDFITNLVDYSFSCLEPQANFSRRIMALSVIDVIYNQQLEKEETGAFLKWVDLALLLTKARYQSLIGCLDDSFELCETKALELLRSLPFTEDVLFDCSYYNKTMEMIQSLRSQTTLSACYRIKYIISVRTSYLSLFLETILRQIEADVESAENDLMSITQKCIHPALNALAIVLEQNIKNVASMKKKVRKQLFKFVSEKVLELCFRIANLVNPVVHSMSPEGYIPEEQLGKMTSCGGEASIRIHAETSQMLLACCWRAHKNVSHILAWTVSTFLAPDHNSPQTQQEQEFPENLLNRIVHHYILQLTECKHCGAFESAVEGFTLLCKSVWNIFKSYANYSHPIRMPEYWLKCFISSLQGHDDGLLNLCSTRRSAGAPHLIVAIISTEPSDSPVQSLRYTLSKLLDMQKIKSVEKRVHCLNVLTAMFSSSLLGERISIGLEWACRVAVDGCSAKDWPERNAAAQLAAALKTRIFGVTRTSQRDFHVDAKNKQSAFEFFTRFSSLYSYLHSHLISARDEFSVYPILIFLTHLFPSNANEYSLSPFIPACLRILLSSNAEKLRRLAATATVALTKEEDQLQLISWLDKRVTPETTQNHVHGAILLLDNLLHYSCSPNVTKKVSELVQRWIAEKLFSTWCDFNFNVLLELCIALNIDVEVTSVSTDRLKELNLSKRPLAYFILAHSVCDSHLLKDDTVRQELYRWMKLEDKKAQNCSKEFISLIVSVCSVSDLESCTVKNAETILDILNTYFDHLPNDLRMTLNTTLLRRLAEDWAMPLTISLARRLLIRLSDFTFTSDDIQWLNDMVDEEDSDAKLIAVHSACTSFSEDRNWKLVAATAEFFEDDDDEVREQISTFLTPLVAPNCDFVLNPVVCQWQLQRHLEENGIVAKVYKNTTSKETSLYDACESNAYREGKFFGNLDDVNENIIMPYINSIC